MSKITAVLIAADCIVVGCGDFESGVAGNSPMAASAATATPVAQTSPWAPAANINPSLEDLAAWPIAASRER